MQAEQQGSTGAMTAPALFCCTVVGAVMRRPFVVYTKSGREVILATTHDMLIALAGDVLARVPMEMTYVVDDSQGAEVGTLTLSKDAGVLWMRSCLVLLQLPAALEKCLEWQRWPSMEQQADTCSCDVWL